MTPPVEWHDNGPESPDFLPPIKRKLWLTPQEISERIGGVLAAAGIKADFCAKDVEITFPDGERGLDDFSVYVDGDSR